MAEHLDADAVDECPVAQSGRGIAGHCAYLYALDARKFHRHDGSAWTVQSTNALGAGQMLVRLDAVVRGGGTFDRNSGHLGLDLGRRRGHVAPCSSLYLLSTDVAQCAFAVDGQVTVVARRNVAIGAYELAVWRTTDGTTWSEVAVPPNSALRASGDSGFVCATVGARAYLTSSADGGLDRQRLGLAVRTPALELRAAGPDGGGTRPAAPCTFSADLACPPSIARPLKVRRPSWGMSSDRRVRQGAG